MYIKKQIINWIEYKKCHTCEVIKKITDFHKAWYSKAWNSVYKSSCKYCRNLMIKNNLLDKHKIIKWKLVKIINEKRLKKNQAKREYYYKNRERLLQQAREYYNNQSDEWKKEKRRKEKIWEKKKLLSKK